MTTILVTGGTGNLGSKTVAVARASGIDVRILSRQRGEGLTTGDLTTGEGLDAALNGVDAVIHAAASHTAADVESARTLFTSAARAGIRHLVCVSIVGIEDIPLEYYRQRLAIEHELVTSGVAHTIQRATQFHTFVDGLFTRQRRSPVVIAPAFSFQPIDVTEVGRRLVDVAVADPQGRAEDVGGPQQLAARELAGQWRAAQGLRRPIWEIRAPGKIAAGYSAGHNLVPGPAYGTRTFAQFLADKYQPQRDGSS